jgi:hypothetical protein
MSKFRELALDVQNNLYDYTYTERMRYKNIYDIIDKYVIENKLFLSNVYKITNVKRSTNSLINYHYDIYCDRPLYHANNLINTIYEEISDDPLVQYLLMNTSVKNEEFVISYDTRFMAKIYAIQSGYGSMKRPTNLGQTIVPVVIDKIQYLPPSVEIIDLYNILYTGIGYDETTTKIVDDLAKLVTTKVGGEVKAIEATIKKPSENQASKLSTSEKQASKLSTSEKQASKLSTSEKQASKLSTSEKQASKSTTNKSTNDNKSNMSDIADIAGGKSNSTCYERKTNELEAIKIALLRDYFKNRLDMILIGSIANNWHLKGDNICPNMERIQIITSVPISDIQAGITQYIESIGRNYTITVSNELGLMIPKDFRTRKTIFSMIIKTHKGMKEKPFLEVFNNAQFELIPAYVSNDMLIGSKYVLLRFLFIDLWIANFVFTIGKLSKEKYVTRQRNILNYIRVISQVPNISDGVLGTFYDYDISKKELIIGQEQYFGPYMVDAYYKKNKKLRIIS